MSPDRSVQHAQVNGIDLAYVREGTPGAPRLLLLNGSGSTMAASAMLFAPLARSFDLVTFDARGIGESTIPDGPFTMADCAADALALADLVGWETFRVVGISFGGMVAQEVAVTAPERIERLALLCTSPGGAGGSSHPLHESPATPTIVDIRFTPEWLADHPDSAAIVEVMAKARAVPKSAEVLRGERAQLEARSHHDVWDRLPRITAPTFVGSGRYDGLAPLVNGEAIASRIPGAELHAYEGGHAFFIQDPQAFPEILAFLAA
ncbi:alpha/beta hydrolase [Aquihabitans sp. McL0605]|uniref:alpha/beta fold hydrolase n=1 Tax=Aquihabitans sp. McL0605 TaxID=3415671 RepID=UPI003CE698B7